MKSWRAKPIDGVPDRVILFDGVCVLCSRWARFVIERDPEASFRFVAVQQPYGRVLAERLDIDTTFPETNAVILGGRAYFKSDAAIEVLSRLPGWRWAVLGRAAPRSVRNAVYDLIARHRYRWFGQSAECLLPTPELARHFLGDAPRG
ncbi:MAG TPA: thiol-disulfide oxidoreductase DCC family protein [Stellaceae bacterium]|nr:thiol-disulfide oxidoreductase DCC family protein [Stellaceae bacterium]